MIQDVYRKYRTPMLHIGAHSAHALLEGGDTAGQVGAVVFRHQPISRDPGHVHDLWSKFAFVIAGEYRFHIGDADIDAAPGTILLIPRGVNHGFTTPSGGEILFVSWPAGNEELFREIGALGDQPAAEAIENVWSRYGTRLKGCPPKRS
jgi:quercetin dioxygenase-like cupin family protein